MCQCLFRIFVAVIKHREQRHLGGKGLFQLTALGLPAITEGKSGQKQSTLAEAFSQIMSSLSLDVFACVNSTKTNQHSTHEAQGIGSAGVSYRWL